MRRLAGSFGFFFLLVVLGFLKGLFFLFVEESLAGRISALFF